MVVLAVNVVRHGAAQCHEACARGRWQEPAQWNQHLQGLAQRHAGLGAHDAGVAVERNQPVERRHVDDAAAGV